TSTGRRVKLQLLPDSLPQPLESELLQHESGYHVLKLEEFTDLEPMLETIRQAGISVVDMVLPQPDLEDVFVEIMRKQ
ncbi:MAG TPA: hypothetical protein PLK99_03100, partial [Burkholderiales bacterium]|nr:hypothetical protein [Burkholderiales bacterium]